MTRAVVLALCLTAATAHAQSSITFNRDVAPILFEHCASCHRPGEIGPFSLLSYADARPRARAIAKAVVDRTMPPWKPEPGFGDFIGSRRLTDAQVATVQRWADDGPVQGAATDLPAPPHYAAGWQLGEPDLVVTLPESYRVAAGGQDVFRNFVIPVPLARARYVRGIEFRPGNARVLHHANIRVDTASAGRTLDLADPEPGFDGLVMAGSFPDGHFLGWTPGQLPPLLPPDMSWRITPGSDLVVQLHLHPGSTSEDVQPSIGFFFTETPPLRTPLMLRIGRQNIDIAAGLNRYVVEDRYTLPVDVDAYGVQPHAHFRAREVKGEATRPDGTTIPLIYIKEWDFNWQDVYRYRTPIPLPKGTIVSMRYIYDNSASNRRNPDRPPKRIRWGQNSSDEMGDLWIQVLPHSSEDRQRLTADFGPKVLAEDAIGYETLLEGDPLNPRLHDAAATLFLGLQNTDRAVMHLTEALRIDPDMVSAHYNLATALVRLDRLPEAAEHLRRALQLQPTLVAARVNLGGVLRFLKRYDESRRELLTVLQTEPNNAVAHTHLAGMLSAQGRPREAVVEYRRALDSNPDLIEPLAALAWTLATSPDANVRQPAEAVRLAERAAVLTSRLDVTVLDTLAAAYAAASRFNDAVSTELAALQRVESAGASTAAAPIRERLALYRRGRPFIDGRPR